MACAVVTSTIVACGAEDAEPGRGERARLDGAADDAELEAIPPPPVIPSGAPKVAFLSDSIGAGLHLARHQAFPSILQRMLADEGLPFELIDSSESGRTTAGGVTALDWVLKREPQLVVLTLGGNDGLRGVPLAEIEANLRAMVTRARAAGARVLLLGVRLPPNYGEYGAGFDALYPRLAEELELDFVPFFMQGVGGVAEANLADGLHPTAAGHAVLAANVAPELRELVGAISAE